MNAWILFLLVLVSFAFANNTLALDENYLQQLQADKSLTWTAGMNDVFVGKTMNEVRGMFAPFAHQNNKNQQELLKYHIPKNILPANYTPDDEFKQCTIGIVNQGQCGSSWAFPVVHASGNRYCIAQAKKHEQAPVLIFSTQYLISCDQQQYCCNGGLLAYVIYLCHHF